MSGWRWRGAALLLVLGVAGLVDRAWSQTPSNSNPAVAAAAQAAADGRLNLDDPKTRDRLRAAGIDPDELQKMMGTVVPANPAAGAAAGTATPATGTGFPPVTPATGTTPVFTDSMLAKQLATPDTSGVLKRFGQSVFTLKPTTFEPLAFGPVSPNYLLGPGDEIIVSVWGGQELSARATINREGVVVLPDVGQVPANGYTLGAFKEQLEKRLSRIYSGIGRDGRGRTSVDVSLGKLRSVQVFVLGDVVQPGNYTLSATSTVMNALFYAGGPTIKGSLRDVRVLRNNQVVSHSDLYGYLARGDRSQDRQLENGDVVFLPPAQRIVSIEGEVRHPAEFELRPGETLADLLDIAGGLTATAYKARVQIERIVPFQDRNPLAQEDRRVLDLDLRGNGSDVQLADGDQVHVFRTRDILKNTVKLVGPAVYKPGTYEHRPGMTVADLIQQAGGLLGDAYTGWAHLIRTRDNKTRELQSFDLEAALRRDPKANLELQQRDEIQVFSLADVRDPEYVTIQGLVRRPGQYELLEGMTIADLVVKAGGLKESAYRMRAEVSRIDPRAISEGKTADLLYAALGDTMNTTSDAARFHLQKNDIVFVREIPNWGLQENVWVTGEVKFPGMYSLTSKTEQLSSVINRAGGLEPTAYLQASTFTRRKDETGRMAIDFELALKKKNKHNKYDLVLAAGDSIHIPREPKTVKVTGEVGFPSSVLWEEGQGMDYYIDQAGGLMGAADKNKISVLMANGRVERPSFMHSPKPDAGAVVRVPHKPEEKDRETLKSMAAIVSILSGAATTIYLISRTTN